jgi:hypothetical protein
MFQNTGDSPMTEVDELKKNFRAIQEENYKLQAVITDVSTEQISVQGLNSQKPCWITLHLKKVSFSLNAHHRSLQLAVAPSYHKDGSICCPAKH